MNNELLSLFKLTKDILDNNGQECKSFHIKNIQPSFKSLNYDDKYDVISIRNKQGRKIYMKYVKAVLNNNNVVNGEMVGLKDNVIILNNATEYYNGKLLNSYNGFVDNSTFYILNIIEDTKEFKLYNKQAICYYGLKWGILTYGKTYDKSKYDKGS